MAHTVTDESGTVRIAIQRQVLFPSRACHGGGRGRPGRAGASEQLFAPFSPWRRPSRSMY
eukprot:7383866-Prymnesium_polylepis.6